MIKIFYRSMHTSGVNAPRKSLDSNHYKLTLQLIFIQPRTYTWGTCSVKASLSDTANSVGALVF